MTHSLFAAPIRSEDLAGPSGWRSRAGARAVPTASTSGPGRRSIVVLLALAGAAGMDLSCSSTKQGSAATDAAGPESGDAQGTALYDGAADSEPDSDAQAGADEATDAPDASPIETETSVGETDSSAASLDAGDGGTASEAGAALPSLSDLTGWYTAMNGSKGSVDLFADDISYLTGDEATRTGGLVLTYLDTTATYKSDYIQSWNSAKDTFEWPITSTISGDYYVSALINGSSPTFADRRVLRRTS
jgi:hypothetical protein